MEDVAQANRTATQISVSLIFFAAIIINSLGWNPDRAGNAIADFESLAQKLILQLLWRGSPGQCLKAKGLTANNCAKWTSGEDSSGAGHFACRLEDGMRRLVSLGGMQ
jgi:hypothetical protein